MGKVSFDKIAELLDITVEEACHLEDNIDKITIGKIKKEAFAEYFIDILDNQNVEVLTMLLSIEDISSLFLYSRADFVEVIDKLDYCNLRGKFLVNLVNYFDKRMDNPTFFDYEYFIEFLFKAAKGYSFNDLSRLGIEKEYLKIVSRGMRFAGEKNETGYAYDGGRTIRDNARFLTQEVIEEILKFNVYFDYYKVIFLLRKRYIFELIHHAKMLSENVKKLLKFKYIDAYVIGEIILLRFIRKYIRTYYSQYHYIDKKFDNKDVKIVLENSESKRLFVKVQIEGDKNFFFITDDVNKDSDSSILNFSVSYSGENVKIESENLKEKRLILNLIILIIQKSYVLNIMMELNLNYSQNNNSNC